MVNGAIESFVRAAAIELSNHRINAVSPTVLEESMEAFGPYFRGFEPVSARRVALAYSKSIEGAQTGQVYRVLVSDESRSVVGGRDRRRRRRGRALRRRRRSTTRFATSSTSSSPDVTRHSATSISRRWCRCSRRATQLAGDQYLAAAASGGARRDRARTAHRAFRAVAGREHARSLACGGCRGERDARDRDDRDAIDLDVRADRVHRDRVLRHARVRARRAARVLVGGRDRRASRLKPSTACSFGRSDLRSASH